MSQPTGRKIIHIDMDCYFAAIEIRDNPSLANKPIAVGGSPQKRGVLTTCNYIARKYGLHSAMATAYALKLCPKLVLLPVNYQKYVAVTEELTKILRRYRAEVEMVSLDEAYLDVTNSPLCRGSATLIARALKAEIKKELRLIASAGVAPNKFLAKIASDWKKPDGLFVITPAHVANFMPPLKVEKLPGVGPVTAKRLHALKIFTCGDLQQFTIEQLSEYFGKHGEYLYQLARGIDDDPVSADRIRKSLSTEETYPVDLHDLSACQNKLPELIGRLKQELQQIGNPPISKQFIKIKFYDFKRTTVETVRADLQDATFSALLATGFARHGKPVRLLGVGVRFKGVASE